MSLNGSRPASRGTGRLQSLWAQRWSRIVIRCLGLLMLARVGLWLALPTALDALASMRGLRCEVDDIALGVLGGTARVEGLVLSERDPPAGASAEPLVTLDHARLDLALLRSLFARPTVERVELDGLSLRLEVLPDGRVPWSSILGLDQPAAPAEDPDPSLPLDFSLPFAARAVRVQQLRVHFVDRSLEAPVDLELVVHARVDDLGGRAKLELVGTCAEALDVLRVHGELRGAGRTLHGRLECDLDGLHPQALSGRLAALGIEPRAHGLSGTFAAALDVTPLAGSDTDCSARLEVRRVHVEHDGVADLDLGAIDVVVPRLARTAVEVGEVLALAPSARIERAPDGALVVAGLALHGADRGEPSAPLAQLLPELPLSVGSVVCESATVFVHDAACDPVTDLELRLVRAELGPLAFDGRGSGAPTKLALAAELPGIVEHVTAAGELWLAPRAVRLDLRLGGDETSLGRIRPQLAGLGLEPTIDGASFQAHLQAAATLVELGTIEAELRLSDVRLDGGEQPLALELCEVGGVRWTGAPAALHVETVEVSGVSLGLRRDSAGSVHAGGLRTLEGTSSGAAAPIAPKAGAPRGPAQRAPQVSIGRVRIHDVRVRVDDETVTPAFGATLGELRIELDALTLGPTAVEAAPARIEAAMAMEGLLASAVLTGSVQPLAAGAHVNALAEVNGFDARPLAGYLAAFGLAPELEDAEVAMELDVRVRAEGSGLAFDAALEPVRLSERGDTLASVAALRITGARVSPERLELGRIEVDRPFLAVTRDTSGALGALGLRQSGAGGVGSSADAADTPASPRIVVSERIELRGARAVLRDETTTPATTVALNASANLERAALAPGAEPFALQAELSIDGALDRATLTGSVTLDPGDLSAFGSLSVDGLRQSQLGPYLPAGLSLDTADGRLRCEYRAHLAPASAGGSAFAAALEHCTWSDGDRELAGIERAAVALRTDPAARLFDVSELSVLGVRARIERLDAERFRAAGVTFDASAQASVAGAAPDAPTVAVAPAERGTASEPGARESGERGTPTLTVGPVALQLSDLVWCDRTHGSDPEELHLALELESAGGVWLAADPSASAPVELLLHGSAEPFCAAFEVSLRAAPFAEPPRLELAARAGPLHGAGLDALAPGLAQSVDASDLSGGELSFALQATADVRRRGPLELDPAAPIVLDLELADCALRVPAGGELLAGVERVRIDRATVDPRSGSVQLPRVEIDTPSARVLRDAQGLHIAGLTLLTAPESEPTPASDAAAKGEAASPAELPDLRVGRVAVAGLDVQLVDRTGEPEARVPLTGIDAELKPFSLRGLANGERLAFNTWLESGRVELPRRVVADSLLEGLASAAGRALAGVEDRAEQEQRPVFGEASLGGSLALVPELDGWASLELEELELATFRGPAAAAGVVVGDGLLDLAVRLRFQGGEVSVDSNSTFTHLALSEPRDGPVSRYLSLPAPLDTVLFLLADAEGRHHVPVAFRIRRDGVDGADLALQRAVQRPA